ncbi:MAG: hypothetical protein JSV63_02910 [Candidatus Aenigmatarchaeota archaeon]|nr:MAG: hypothetical protein JSV63_02910 [Candidatus Aenigmarchaeota archaeon]
MELTIRTIVVLIIILVAGLVFGTMILGWGDMANTWMVSVTEPLKELIFPGN